MGLREEALRFAAVGRVQAACFVAPLGSPQDRRPVRAAPFPLSRPDACENSIVLARCWNGRGQTTASRLGQNRGSVKDLRQIDLEPFRVGTPTSGRLPHPKLSKPSSWMRVWVSASGAACLCMPLAFESPVVPRRLSSPRRLSAMRTWSSL
jgi:hypothetical protein